MISCNCKERIMQLEKELQSEKEKSFKYKSKLEKISKIAINELERRKKQ